MKKPINRQKQSTRKAKMVLVSLGVCAVLVLLILAITKGPGLINSAVSRVRAVYHNQVTSRLSGMMRLEQIDWQQMGSSNLSSRVPVELLKQASGLELGKPMLEIDLAELEKRLLSVPWLESVHIQKQLPSTLTIRYAAHHARALGLRDGKPWLISTGGQWIAPAGDLIAAGGEVPDLPFIASEANLDTGLAWLNAIERDPGRENLSVHEVNLAADNRKMNAVVELKYLDRPRKVKVIGMDEPRSESLIRLKRVVQYLIKNNILVSAIDIRPGKKVVVNVRK